MEKKNRNVDAALVECVHHNKDNGQTTHEKYLIGFDLVKDKGLFMLIANQKTPNNLLVVPFAELAVELLEELSNKMYDGETLEEFLGGKKK